MGSRGACQVPEGNPSAFENNEQVTGRPGFFALRDVRWEPSSFWGQRLTACEAGTLPTLNRLMLGKDRSHFIENFRIAAGLSEGRHRGPGWNDGDTYKWIEALSAMYAQTGDSELLATIDSAIDIIGKAQRADGYLHTPVLIAQRAGDSSAKPFGDPVNFEMYNFGHLMTAACVHFQVTNDRRFLEIAIKSADFLVHEFSKPDAELARHAICPAHYMGILDLYRVTGEAKYLQLCKRWLDMRELVSGGDDNQDRIPFREQREAVGHAVRANYLYAGAADLYLETQEEALRLALQGCWESVQERKIYVTGGCGALFDGASPDGSPQQKSITRIHQAYGRNYQLPNSTAHNETCAAIGNVLWNYRMWRLSDRHPSPSQQETGNPAAYFDALENSLYNAVLAGVSLDGERFFYTNTLRQLHNMPTELRWPRERQEWISCYCCPPNVARTVASVANYAYDVREDQASVLLYGSNSLSTTLKDGSQLRISQRSNYPWDGNITLNIHSAPSGSFSLRLRIPKWADNAKVSVNGEAQSIAIEPQSFAELTRTWAEGDTIELNLSMSTTLLSAHPLVEECRGQIAVQRGPLIYCLESLDLPESTSVLAVSISPETTWETASGMGELADIRLLRGELSVASSDEPTSEKTLYRPYKSASQRVISAELLPYFAWGNRGPSEMTVWIKVQE